MNYFWAGFYLVNLQSAEAMNELILFGAVVLNGSGLLLGLLHVLIYLIVVALVIWLLIWLICDTLGAPDIIRKLLIALGAVIAVIVLVQFLLGGTL